MKTTYTKHATDGQPAMCPQCGSTFTIDEQAMTREPYAPAYHTIGQPLPTRKRSAIVAFCNGCEMCIELMKAA